MKKKIFITIFTLLVVLMNSLTFTASAEPLEPEYLPTPAESTMTADYRMTQNNETSSTGEVVIIDGATTSTAAPVESIVTGIETEMEQTTTYAEQDWNVVTSIATEMPTTPAVQPTSSESNNTLVIVIALASGVIIVGLIVIIVLLLKKKS